MALESRIRRLESSGGSRLNTHDRRVLERERLRKLGRYIELTPEQELAASEQMKARCRARDKAAT